MWGHKGQHETFSAFNKEELDKYTGMNHWSEGNAHFIYTNKVSQGRELKHTLPKTMLLFNGSWKGLGNLKHMSSSCLSYDFIKESSSGY